MFAYSLMTILRMNSHLLPLLASGHCELPGCSACLDMQDAKSESMNAIIRHYKYAEGQTRPSLTVPSPNTLYVTLCLESPWVAYWPCLTKV